MSYDRRKVRTGRVVSNKMDRTVVVQVERQSRHRLYKKLMRRRSKLVAHDPENVAMVGDLVEVIESRPISKTKRWRLVKVLQKGGVVDVRPNEVEPQTQESPEETPVAEPEVEPQTQESPEETPDAEPEVDEQIQESPEETPVAEPEVEPQTQESPEETPDAEPEVESQTQESPDETLVAEPEVEPQTQESPDETLVAGPEVEPQTQESPDETPVAEPEVESQTQESPEETPVAGPDVESQTQESPEETLVAGPDVESQTQESPEETPAAEPEVAEQTEQADPVPFASLFFNAQTSTPLDAPANIEVLPNLGPLTQKQAAQDAKQSLEQGQLGQHIQKTACRWQPTKAADELAKEFRDMVHGDYGKLCQVCGRSFVVHGRGELQVYVVHIVQPSADNRTNDFGNLMGLCGWHYSLVRYGEWTFIDPQTSEPAKNSEQMKNYMLNVPVQEDDEGYPYVAVGIRFWNVYERGNPNAAKVDEEIRYSTPHWEYFLRLLSE